MPLRRRSRGATVWLGILAAVIATVAFAPIVTVGWCADADETGTSTCGSRQTSLVGIETSVWLWAVVITAVVITTAVLARPRRAPG
ncbi:hypothetical protein [Microbacterium aurantiacum]|uniref:hypothetical protein n=1 Tax=Microbacterium aurantiacum TaxID=162393 RepID=UPI003D72A0E7